MPGVQKAGVTEPLATPRDRFGVRSTHFGLLNV